MMHYERPIVQILNECSEGVYMASGANANSAAVTQPGGSPSSYSLTQTNAWDGNRQYDITLTNNTDAKVDSITVVLSANGNVTSIGGNVSGSVSGGVATITCNNYGNGFEAGATATFYMLVTGTGDFSLE